jgi:hypothetical protein
VGENSWNGYENNLMYANLGNGDFVDIGRASGSDSIRDARGVGVADLNRDGRLDLVINNNNKPPTIYLNELQDEHNWLQIELVGNKSNRDAVGARVRLTVAGKTLTRLVGSGSGYASQSMLPLHFGLGTAERVEALEIHWPSGRVDRLEGDDLAALGELNRRVRIEEQDESVAKPG